MFACEHRIYDALGSGVPYHDAFACWSCGKNIHFPTDLLMNKCGNISTFVAAKIEYHTCLIVFIKDAGVRKRAQALRQKKDYPQKGINEIVFLAHFHSIAPVQLYLSIKFVLFSYGECEDSPNRIPVFARHSSIW